MNINTDSARGADMSYYYETPLGLAEILFFDGHWNAIFSGRRLGTHNSPQQAAAQASSAWVHIGDYKIDLATLNIPDQLKYWKQPLANLPSAGTIYRYPIEAMT